MRFDELYSYIIHKLTEGVPGYITYHNVDHTRQVLATASEIGNHERLTDDEMVLLKTGALLHDVGFLQSHENHEEISCRYAAKILPEYGYTQQQIDQVYAIILATKIPQSPHTLLAKIVCDADLFYLGSNEYSFRASLLEAEYRKLGILSDQSDWTTTQINFISNHKFFTDYAQEHAEPVKQQHLEKLLLQKQSESPSIKKRDKLIEEQVLHQLTKKKRSVIVIDD